VWGELVKIPTIFTILTSLQMAGKRYLLFSKRKRRPKTRGKWYLNNCVLRILASNKAEERTPRFVQ